MTDQYTRRIIGFGIRAGIVESMTLCRMFKQAIRGASTPKYLSSDHDPLYRFHQWTANLRILDIREIKTVPYVQRSYPFVDRLIGTIRRECLDRLLFWTATDLELKLTTFLLTSKTLTFDGWADWFVERRSKPPFRSEMTHAQNLNALKHLRPAFGQALLADITPTTIEDYLWRRLDSEKCVCTKVGVRRLNRPH